MVARYKEKVLSRLESQYLILCIGPLWHICSFNGHWCNFRAYDWTFGEILARVREDDLVYSSVSLSDDIVCRSHPEFFLFSSCKPDVPVSSVPRDMYSVAMPNDM